MDNVALLERNNIALLRSKKDYHQFIIDKFGEGWLKRQNGDYQKIVIATGTQPESKMPY